MINRKKLISLLWYIFIYFDFFFLIFVFGDFLIVLVASKNKEELFIGPIQYAIIYNYKHYRTNESHRFLTGN